MNITSSKNRYFQAYGLSRDPFPDDRIDNLLYLTPELTHRLEQIIEAICETEKLVLVTSVSGAGKTMLADYLKSIPRPGWVMGLVQADSQMDRDTLAYEIIQDVSPDKADDIALSVSQLHKFLEQCARNSLVPVIIIDDAHKLPVNALEFVLQLAELRYAETLFRLVLFANEQINDHFANSKLRDLAQGRLLTISLPALSLEQTREYIANRLGSSGDKHPSPFSDQDIRHIYTTSGGLPRGINLLCRSLMQDILTKRNARRPTRWRVAGLGITAGIAWAIYSLFPLTTTPDPVSVTPPPGQDPATVITDTGKPDTPQNTVTSTAAIPQTLTVSDMEQAKPPADITDNPETSNRDDAIFATPSEQAEADRVHAAPRLSDQADDGNTTAPVLAAQAPDSNTTHLAGVPAVAAAEPQDTPVQLTTTLPYRQEADPARENIFHLDQVPPLFAGIRGPDWLRQQPGDAYVLQMISASDIENVRKLLSGSDWTESQLSGYTRYTPSGKPRYLVFYGKYADREAALAAIDGLPARLKAVKPWPTSIRHALAELDKAPRPP